MCGSWQRRTSVEQLAAPPQVAQLRAVLNNDQREHEDIGGQQCDANDERHEQERMVARAARSSRAALAVAVVDIVVVVIVVRFDAVTTRCRCR